jgi:hypothetical protein
MVCGNIEILALSISRSTDRSVPPSVTLLSTLYRVQQVYKYNRYPEPPNWGPRCDSGWASTRDSAPDRITIGHDVAYEVKLHRSSVQSFYAKEKIYLGYIRTSTTNLQLTQAPRNLLLFWLEHAVSRQQLRDHEMAHVLVSPVRKMTRYTG